MSKPNTLHDLHLDGQFSLADADNIGRDIFDGNRAVPGGLDGYLVTTCDYDDLPDHVKGFVRKAILAFNVENILDAGKPEHGSDEDYKPIEG
jgi:hypothetical protein